MRALAMLIGAVSLLAVSVPEVASAADGCGRGRAFNGYRCVTVAPRFYAPAFRAPAFAFAPRHSWRDRYGYRGRHHWR